VSIKFLYHQARAYKKKYNAEIWISIISTIPGVVLAKAADIFLSAPTIQQIIIGIETTIAALLALLAFVIKRNVTSRVVSLQQRVDQIAGRSLPTQYDQRKLHFSEEKSRLVEYLVKTTLPEQIKAILSDKPGDSFKITIAVDSGTTLEPLFARIKLIGLAQIENELGKLELYTNSLSGSDAFCREPGTVLNQDQVHLFGGTQIEKYRAVVGDVTLKAMDALKEEYRINNGVIIGLITANWLLIGSGYDEMILCSSEPGHLAYKKRLAEIADKLIIVTPLGKLLRLDSTDELNNILRLKEEGKPEYEGFSVSELPVRNRENTHLLTTHRTWLESILYTHSENLRIACAKRHHEKYTLCDRNPHLSLDHQESRQKQVEIEMPHAYLRQHSLQLLQFS
ncbi:MAG: hypothetical protein MN733_06275, partial [Nitrososphaera sp.]|nr:hypothetical protein [Nitrososphaera sp.]